MIDTYFKQYFWTFHVAVLIAAGLLVARAANIFVGEALRPSAAAIAAAPSEVRPAAVEETKVLATTAFLERNVFHAEREDLTPEPEAAPAAPAQPAAADMSRCGDKSQMRVTLVGTIVNSRDETLSAATFSDPNKNEPDTYFVGDQLLAEATIKSIDSRVVKVDHQGKCEYFTIEDETLASANPGGGEEPPGDAVAAAPPPASDAPPDKVDLGGNVKKLSETEYEIQRSEIDNVLGNLNVVATQARIVPSFRNGKANGFKLFSIRPGSLYSKIGIQNGDIIQKINGYEINSPDKALEIYTKLKDANSITVDLIRRGRTQTLNYGIR